MTGQVFRRCSKCLTRLKPRARRCACGHPNYSWYFAVDTVPGRKNRKRVLRGGFPTRETAEYALNEIVQAIAQDSYVESSTETLEDFFTIRWLPAMKPPTLEATTWAEYSRKIRNQIIPRLGALPIQKLQPTHLNRLYAELLAHGRTDDKGGLAPKTVREVHVILRKALSDAVRWGLLTRNVAVNADPPSYRMASVARQAIMRVWSAEELHAFLDHVRDDRLFAVWMLAANTGMRRSEVGGARWQDLLFDSARLAVRQRLASVDGHPQLSVPKSPRSRRTIDLDRRTLEALKLHRERQLDDRRRWGPAWHDLDLIAAREDGMWIHPDWLSEMFRAHVKATGLPKIRLHDLRHTHASLLLARSAHPKIVSERLGHHSVAFTLDTYAHVMPGMQAEAAESLADAIFDEPEPDEDAEATTGVNEDDEEGSA
ncbi:MAG: site-specific integrase [Egibacteraceae bacterium]